MATVTQVKKDVRANFGHLARDPLYLKQKPYAADFAVDPRIGSNHLFERVEITVHDARPNKSSFTLDKNGFCFRDRETSATFDSLKMRGPAIEEYYRDMEDVVRQNFPEYSRIDVIDHGVRSRPSEG